MKLPKTKQVLTIAAALIIPGGLIALGLWKVYKSYKNKAKKIANKSVV